MTQSVMALPKYFYFRLPGASWEQVDPLAASEDEERRALREFLLASLQMQNLTVLTGSGTSLNADGPTMNKLWEACTTDPEHRTEFADVVQLCYRDVSPEPNIEDLLSRCDAVLQLGEHPSIASFKRHAIRTILGLCKKAGADLGTLEHHMTFLRRLARRRVRDSRLKLFTTNYDLCFERAAGEVGLVALDGFSFSYPRRFDPVFFDYDLVRRGGGGDATSFVPGVFQYFKLHGSVDWAQKEDGRIAIEPDVNADEACLIYPASTKFRLSFRQPHLELMGRYLAALREPNTCLLVIGFGFNDDHLSGPLVAAIESNPHLRVIVVSPTAKDDVEGHPWWKKLQAHNESGADVAFIAATFTDFVTLIPDLRALSPAERLQRAVKDVVNGAGQ